MNGFSGAIAQLGPWAWMVAGLVLLGLELMAPGVFLMWFGIAALITGGIAFATDFGWQVDFLVFVVIAVVAVLIGRRTFSQRDGEQPLLNQRAQRLVGATYLLAEPIATGQGRVRIDDTTWRIAGPDLPAGTRVRVTGVEGTVLRVERAD